MATNQGSQPFQLNKVGLLYYFSFLLANSKRAHHWISALFSEHHLSFKTWVCLSEQPSSSKFNVLKSMFLIFSRMHPRKPIALPHSLLHSLVVVPFLHLPTQQVSQYPKQINPWAKLTIYMSLVPHFSHQVQTQLHPGHYPQHYNYNVRKVRDIANALNMFGKISDETRSPELCHCHALSV